MYGGMQGTGQSKTASREPILIHQSWFPCGRTGNLLCSYLEASIHYNSTIKFCGCTELWSLNNCHTAMFSWTAISVECGHLGDLMRVSGQSLTRSSRPRVCYIIRCQSDFIIQMLRMGQQQTDGSYGRLVYYSVYRNQVYLLFCHISENLKS